MAVEVIEGSVTYTEAAREGRVSIFADTREDAESNEGLSAAVAALVQHGMPNPGLNSSPAAYPVNTELVCSPAVQTGQEPVHGFRRDLRYLSRL